MGKKKRVIHLSAQVKGRDKAVGPVEHTPKVHQTKLQRGFRHRRRWRDRRPFRAKKKRGCQGGEKVPRSQGGGELERTFGGNSSPTVQGKSKKKEKNPRRKKSFRLNRRARTQILERGKQRPLKASKQKKAIYFLMVVRKSKWGGFGSPTHLGKMRVSDRNSK